MKKISLFLTFAILLGILSGCSPKNSSFTESNNGQPTTIKVGAKLIIELDSNPSTGYTWEISVIDERILKKSGDPEFKPASSTPMPGQGGTQIFYFEAVAPGTTTLTLIYHRPFETSVPPTKTYTIKVIVEK